MSSNQDFWYRIAKSSLPIIFVVTFTILVIGFLVRDTVRDHDREVMQRRNIINLQQKFAEEIAVAKRVTADPCVTIFYKVVTPPTEINDSSRLIMMGAEISSINSPLDSTNYQLRLQKDRVELWTSFVATQRYEKGSLTWIKIGEKFSLESPICAGK